MARNGPGDDFHNQPTQHGGFGVGGAHPPGEAPPPPAPAETPPDRFEQPPPDYLDEETEPTPWYRRPAMLIAWVVFVLILIALIVYGIVELIGGNQGTTPTPGPSSTPSTTTTTTTTPTTATTAPPSSSAVEPPAQQPAQQQPPQQQPGTQQPTHHHHLPTLPPVISIPGVPTVLTVPPGLR